MNRWVARSIAVLLAVAAAYLVYANAHAGTILLECTLAAAVLAIATVLVVRKRPVVALILNAVWVAGAFVASVSLTPNRQLPNLTVSSQPPSQQVSSSAASVPIASNAWQASTADPSLRAADEQVVPTIVLGTAQVDDGIVEESYAEKAVKAVSAAAAAFGTAAPSTPDPKLQNARELEAAIPTSEYNLDRLADTLPADPIAVYRFVRDNVGTDIYAGSMRGPLGAWMGRAANSADKARLLAWLLAKKNVAARFERGTLSDAERGQVLESAKATRPLFALQNTGDAARYTNSRAAAGAEFASWATAKLQAAGVALGTNAIDASRVPAQHYWIRVYAGGKQIDLDPTLPTMQEGRHLGTADASFKESPTFPNDDTMHVRVRLIAVNAGSETILAESTGAIPDVAYSPLIAGITPQDGNPSVLETAIVFGSSATDGKPISTSQLPDSLVLQVDRASGAGVTVTVRRKIFDRSSAGSNASQAITGIHTIVLAPGAAPMFFMYESFRDALALSENAAAQASGAKKPWAGLYPTLLANFYMRDDALATVLGQRNGIRLFRDRPDLVMVHATGSPANPQTIRKVFDIADNGTNAVASPAALASANLARGWGDTWIESDLLPGTGAMTAWLSDKRIATYAVSRNAPDNLNAADVALVASVGTPQWWDVDPSTASVVGRLNGGWGEELSEEAIMLRKMQKAYEIFELDETAEECEKGNCAEAVCKMAISGALYAHSLAEAEIKAVAIVAEVIFGKTMGLGCGALGHGEGGGGEGGGEPPGGNGGGDPPCMCSQDPHPGDGNGP